MKYHSLLPALLGAMAVGHVASAADAEDLIRAAKAGDAMRVSSYLAEGLNVNATDVFGMTALHEAALAGHGDVVRLLLEKGADVHATGAGRCTALHDAAMRNHVDIARMLLEKGADVNAPDINGLTPLHVASRELQPDMVRFLIQQGADVQATNDSGANSLDMAVERRDDLWVYPESEQRMKARQAESCIKLLREAGGEKRKESAVPPPSAAAQRAAGKIVGQLQDTAARLERSYREKEDYRAFLERARAEMKAVFSDVRDEEVLFLAAQKLYAVGSEDVSLRVSLLLTAYDDLLIHLCERRTARAHQYLRALKQTVRDGGLTFINELEVKYFGKNAKRPGKVQKGH